MTSVSPSYLPTDSPYQDGFEIGRMGHVHVDAPRLTIALFDQVHDLGRLHEEERAAGQTDRGNAPGHAGLAGREGDLALQDLLVVLLHDVLRPLLHIGVGQIADAVVRLLAGAVGDAVADIGVARIVATGGGEPGTRMNSVPPGAWPINRSRRSRGLS